MALLLEKSHTRIVAFLNNIERGGVLCAEEKKSHSRSLNYWKLAGAHYCGDCCQHQGRREREMPGNESTGVDHSVCVCVILL